jgi:hypothetical protein
MFFTKLVTLGLAAVATAHPGHEAEEHRAAIAARTQRVNTRRALENCAASLESRGHVARAVERRSAEAAKQRIARRIPVNSKPKLCTSTIYLIRLTRPTRPLPQT